MGLISGSVLWIIMASAGSLAANVGLNTLQSWYDPLYVDYFWGSQDRPAAGNPGLAREEAQVSAALGEDADTLAPSPSHSRGFALSASAQ